MKIYLIAPKNPESFWTFDRILPSLKKKCVFPNLSLPTVAGLTPREHEVVLCDENVEPIDFDTDADIVGLTGYVVHAKRLFDIAAEFRRRGKFLVAGGPFASLCPERLRDRVDVVFVDEAEYSWPQFLEDYAAGSWKPEYRQLEKPSMHDSPLPRFDLLKLDRYRTMTIQFARGCPFQCEFCDIIVMYGRRPRTKTVAQVMAEVREIHRLGLRRIFVVDDNFIGNKKEAKELLHALVEWQESNGYPMELMTEVTLNVAQDDELLQLMREANFTTIFVGIETPRAASLEETHKLQNLRGSILDSVHRIQRAGIEVMAGMIVGFDHDDTSIFEEQFHFIQQARIPISMTGLLNAMPTDAPLRASEEGGPSGRRVGRRPVRAHQRHSPGNVAGAAVRGLPESSPAPVRIPQLPAARHAAHPRARHPDSGPRHVERPGPPDLRPRALDLRPEGLASPRLAHPVAHGRNGPAPPAVPAPGRHARPHAQAPLRIHARRLRAARRARGRAEAGEGAGNFGSRERAGLTASFGFGSTVQVHPLTRR